MIVNVASACREIFCRYDEAAETYKKGLELAPEALQQLLCRECADCTVGPVSPRKDLPLKEGLQKAIQLYIPRESQRNI